MRVAETAVAALGETNARAGLRQIRKQRLAVFREHLRARRHLDGAVAPVRTRSILPHAGRTALRREMLLITVVDERVEVLHALDPDVAAITAVAAVRPAELDELLTPERNAAVSASAGLYVDLGLIEKFHDAKARMAIVHGLRSS